MKVSLVVASGAHKGKAIPVPGAQLVIGRAEGCHLRPASPAVSNRHAAVAVRGGKVFVSDLGSTNGTFVNDAPVSGEVEVKSGDRLKVGPLDFTIDVAGSVPAGMKPVAPPKPAAETASAAALNPTPAEGQPPAADKPAAAAKKPAAAPEDEDAAALLLAMGDDDVPEGGTVTDMPTVDPNNPTAPAKTGGAGPAGTPIPTKESSSSAAANLLSKYMKRPTTPPGKGK